MASFGWFGSALGTILVIIVQYVRHARSRRRAVAIVAVTAFTLMLSRHWPVPLTPQSLIPNPHDADAKSPERVRRMFGQIARRYDLLNRLFSLGIDLWWRRRTVRLVPPADDVAPIFDVCTGTGDLALAYRAGWPGGRIVGADFCRPMLALARHKCRRAAAAAG